MNGEIPGCYDYDGEVTIQVKAHTSVSSMFEAESHPAAQASQAAGAHAATTVAAALTPNSSSIAFTS